MESVQDWMKSLVDWLATSKVAGVVGGLGLLVTVVGFGITLYQVRKSRTAAEAAARSANQVRQTIEHFDAIAECATAIQALEEIERMHRAGPIGGLPDRYTAVKKGLIGISRVKPGPSEAHRTELQDAIVQITMLKNTVEKLIAQNELRVNSSKLNDITSKMIATLTELSAELRRVKAQGES
jgi:hypothetical protein